MSSRDIIISHIKQHWLASADELAKVAGISRQAAQKTAMKLVKDGVLEKWHAREDERGRPTVLFADRACVWCEQEIDESGRCACYLFPCDLCGGEARFRFECDCRVRCDCIVCSLCIVDEGKVTKSTPVQISTSHLKPGSRCKHCYARDRRKDHAVLVHPRRGSVLVPRLNAEKRDGLMVVEGKIAWEHTWLTATEMEFDDVSADFIVDRRVSLAPNEGIIYNTTSNRFERFDGAGGWLPLGVRPLRRPSDYIVVLSEQPQEAASSR